MRFVIVRDAEKKRQLGEWYIQPWKEYFAAAMEGIREIERRQRRPEGHLDRLRRRPQGADGADQFAEAFGEHPAVVVVCAALGDTHPTDTDLGRLSIVGGASVYPIVQNFCLALRAQGVATTFTTLLCLFEPQVKELLDIPEEFATACHVVAGYPAKGFPSTLLRRPVEELAFVDTFGQPLGGA